MSQEQTQLFYFNQIKSLYAQKNYTKVYETLSHFDFEGLFGTPASHYIILARIEILRDKKNLWVLNFLKLYLMLQILMYLLSFREKKMMVCVFKYYALRPCYGFGVKVLFEFFKRLRPLQSYYRAREIQTFSPNNISALLFQAQFLSRQKQFESSLNLYHKILEIAPRDSRYRSEYQKVLALSKI